MISLILYLISAILLLLFLIFMSVYGLSLIYSSVMGSPYVPTRSKVILDILKEVKFKKDCLFVELGSGDGRVSRLATKFYGVKSVGIDVNPLLVFWANVLVVLDSRLRGNDNRPVFKIKNIFDYDFSKTDYLYIFLMPDLIKKLAPKLKQELKKNAIIISHGFPVDGLKNRLIKKVDRRPFPTYYYKT